MKLRNIVFKNKNSEPITNDSQGIEHLAKTLPWNSAKSVLVRRLKTISIACKEKSFKNFPTEDGLPANNVNSIMEDRKGKM